MLEIKFNPKPDITAYELSLIFILNILIDAERNNREIILPGMDSKSRSVEYLNGLPENVLRHIERVEE